ncbi:hypothetical protein QBC41DRAFT_65609 [Cercophora samala]|uniref:F-box domain-containing protein n=1 Tax=Cercophora samala TaxID=330535 RepID=A0AA39YJD2_9PEZI|nr:hypothetical protein QBC41DRAFT_65609 [Cercophora samala]
MDEQCHSPLFHIPFEVRDAIYSCLFTSTTLTFTTAVPYDDGSRAIFQPPMYPVALLRTCRRVNAEIAKSWLSQVLFHFNDPMSMLDKLAAISLEKLSLVRYIIVRGEPLMLTYPPKRQVQHRLVGILKLLPRLQLRRLTVLGGRCDKYQYRMLDELVKYGNGWQELRFISNTSEMLGYAYYCLDSTLRDRYQRRPQPEYWQSVMEERDGVQSNPSVLIYRARRAGHRGDVLEPETRELIAQSHTKTPFPDDYEAAEDPVLMSENERGKELMVVVRRGQCGVDYGEKVDSPLLPDRDIRRDFPGKTWLDIRRVCIEAAHTIEVVGPPSGLLRLRPLS